MPRRRWRNYLRTDDFRSLGNLSLGDRNAHTHTHTSISDRHWFQRNLNTQNERERFQKNYQGVPNSHNICICCFSLSISNLHTIKFTLCDVKFYKLEQMHEVVQAPLPRHGTALSHQKIPSRCPFETSSLPHPILSAADVFSIPVSP